jgi:hypothetical protein
VLYDNVDADSYGASQITPRYIEWEPDTTLVSVPKLTLKQAGWKAIKYPVLRVSAKSYLDTQTGEIISKRDMFERRAPVPRNPSVKLIEQLCVLNTLKKRVKDLAVFLLSMRNSRGSFVLPLERLIDGYINRQGKVTRIARARGQHLELIGDIARAGIIANEQALGSLFQRHGINTTQSVLEESFIWYGWPGIFSGKSVWAP